LLFDIVDVVVVVVVVVGMANERGADLGHTSKTMECGRANGETTTLTCSDNNQWYSKNKLSIDARHRPSNDNNL
jgi:hypothetical protein